MFNKSKYGKLLTVILIIVVVAIVGILFVIGHKTYNSYYINMGAAEAARQFEEAIQNNSASNHVTTTYKEFTVIGTIRIPAIEFKYPILKENTTKSLETSVVLMYTAQGLNNEGNSIIIGHNYRNGTIFSNLKELKKGDYIYITDAVAEDVQYKVYSIYNVPEDDNAYITRKVYSTKEICLVTSTDDSESKIIVLAKAE